MQVYFSFSLIFQQKFVFLYAKNEFFCINRKFVLEEIILYPNPPQINSLQTRKQGLGKVRAPGILFIDTGRENLQVKDLGCRV